MLRCYCTVSTCGMTRTQVVIHTATIESAPIRPQKFVPNHKFTIKNSREYALTFFSILTLCRVVCLLLAFSTMQQIIYSTITQQDTQRQLIYLKSSISLPYKFSSVSRPTHILPRQIEVIAIVDSDGVITKRTITQNQELAPC